MNRYEIFAPEQMQRIPLNANTAQLISSVAYVFYQLFPKKVLKADFWMRLSAAIAQTS
ncbi:hypothetical protein [Calothrix sp. PCC 7507]|uniref:hypothetical protein n=1 Tax=Calothrix sp. PCC 7507 TaxID=99598 RepID=UPI0002E71206|nr:hypothetical protein [Calothrix sp. PCC 7507]